MKIEEIREESLRSRNFKVEMTGVQLAYLCALTGSVYEHDLDRGTLDSMGMTVDDTVSTYRQLTEGCRAGGIDYIPFPDIPSA